MALPDKILARKLMKKEKKKLKMLQDKAKQEKESGEAQESMSSESGKSTWWFLFSWSDLSSTFTDIWSILKFKLLFKPAGRVELS